MTKNAQKRTAAAYTALAIGQIFLGVLRRAPVSGIPFPVLYILILRGYKLPRKFLYIWSTFTILLVIGTLKSASSILSSRDKVLFYGVIICSVLAILVTYFYAKHPKDPQS